MKPKLRNNSILLNVFVLLLSTVSAGIGLMLWFQLRETLMGTLLYLSIDKWKLPVLDHFSFLLLGIGWLIFVLLTHHFYGKGLKKGNLLSVFLLFSGFRFLYYLFVKVLCLFWEIEKV